MQIITIINKQKRTLKNKIALSEKKGSLGKILSAEYKLLLKMLNITSDIVWNMSLIKTSIEVTRTPLVTIKSMVNANLNHRKKDKEKLKLPRLPVAYKMPSYQLKPLSNTMLRKNAAFC